MDNLKLFVLGFRIIWVRKYGFLVVKFLDELDEIFREYVKLDVFR